MTEERNNYGERKVRLTSTGSKIVGYAFLVIAAILIIEAIINILSAYGILPVGHIFTYLSGPSYIVEAIKGFFIMTVITTIAFGVIAIVATVGLLQEQEWAAGISLILMGLVAFTMVCHLIINPGILGSISLALEIAAFGISLCCAAYLAKNFKRYD